MDGPIIDSRDYVVVSNLSPAVQKLVDALPIMRDGKPRRFRLYCECFEWTFTQMQREAQRLNTHHLDVAHLAEKVERHAYALWLHQNRSLIPSRAA